MHHGPTCELLLLLLVAAVVAAALALPSARLSAAGCRLLTCHLKVHLPARIRLCCAGPELRTVSAAAGESMADDWC